MHKIKQERMMSAKKMINSVIIWSITILFTTTCKDTKQENENRTVFNYNEMAGIASLDPASANNLEDIWAVNQVYNGLVQLDDSLQVTASLAKRWAISDDGLTYTFILRDDVFMIINVLKKKKEEKLLQKILFFLLTDFMMLV